MNNDRGFIGVMALTTLVIVTSRWVQKQPLTPKIGVGAAFTAIGLSAIYTWDPRIGKGLAATILVTTVVVDGPPVFKALSNVSSAPLGNTAKLGGTAK